MRLKRKLDPAQMMYSLGVQLTEVKQVEQSRSKMDRTMKEEVK
jgi:hypothetical protein